MDPLYSIFGLIAIVVVVTLWLLPIILFFKVWGMCNDVKRIKEITSVHLNPLTFSKVPF